MSSRETRSVGNSRKHPRSDTSSFSASIGSQQIANEELLQEEITAGLQEEEEEEEEERDALENVEEEEEVEEEEVDHEDGVEDEDVVLSSGNTTTTTSTDNTSSFFGRQQAGKRVRLTLGQKREVVDLAASKKFTHRELAEKFHVGRTTITNICRQEDLIRHETDSADATKKRRKTTKVSYDLRILDECLHKWRMELKVSSPDIKITGTILQQHAMEIAAKILAESNVQLPDKVRVSLEKFGASNGWLDGFRTRFGSFSTKQIQNDQQVIKSVEMTTRIREIHQSLLDISPQDIWTCTEFPLAYSFFTKAFEPISYTQDDMNINSLGENGKYTVSLFLNAAGESFDLQVIGLDPNIQIEFEKYPIIYGFSKTGWQVAHTMVTLLKALNVLAKKRKRFFRVILDSAVPHVKAAMLLDSQGDQRTFFMFDHLYLFFLPSNFKPPKFSPCHFGLIQLFKARFRYEMLETIVHKYRVWKSKISTNQNDQRTKNFDPNDFVQGQKGQQNVFHWLSIALKSLKKKIIQKAWLQSGLLPTKTIASYYEFQQLNTSTRLCIEEEEAMKDLQRIVEEIIQNVPEFLGFLGVSIVPPMPLDSSSSSSSSFMMSQQIAFSLVEIEGNAAATDPGIDEAQIIRSVLQKHGYLSSSNHTTSPTTTTTTTTTTTSSSHSSSHSSSQRQVEREARREQQQYQQEEEQQEEKCPSRDQVLASIKQLKEFARLSKDPLENRMELIVQLNQLQATTCSTKTNAYFDTALHSTSTSINTSSAHQVV